MSFEIQREQKKIPLIIDTDTYNEIDDQFALVYAFAHKELFDIKAITAAPYFHERVENPCEGMLNSYDEILNICNLYGKDCEGLVFKGADRFLTDKCGDVVESEAVSKIIELALAQDDQPLYIVAIAAATNIASAIRTCPEIKDKINLLWLGGHPHYWDFAKEFNLRQDIPAAKELFDCGMNFLHVPCFDVAKKLTVTRDQMAEGLKDCSLIGDYLLKIFSDYMEAHGLTEKTVWDIAPVAYLVNKLWVQTKEVVSPVLTDDMKWILQHRRHKITVATDLDEKAVFSDFFGKLRAEKAGVLSGCSCNEAIN